MKKLILVLVFQFIYQAFYAQNVNTELILPDSAKLQERNFFDDTLWVMDSSYTYHLNYGALGLTSTYTIKSRDEMGNKTSALRKQLNFLQQTFEKSELDSVFYYAGTGELHSIKTFGWNSLDEIWMDNRFILNSPNGKFLESYSKGWNTRDNQYSSGSRLLNIFEGDLILIVEYQQYVPENDDWLPTRKTEYLYDDFGNISLSFTTVWNNETALWENQKKSVRQFDELSNISDVYEYSWNADSSVWDSAGHIQYSYNVDQQIDTLLIYNWSQEENKFIYDRLSTYKYETSDIRSEMIVKEFNAALHKWQNSAKYEYHYSGLDNTTNSFEGDTINDTWIPSSRQFQSFNSQSQPDTTQSERWNLELNDWEYVYRIVNIFDERYNQTEENFYDWGNQQDNWELQRQTIYYWSPFNPLAIGEYDNVSVRIFPNPAISKLNIELPDEYTVEDVIIEIIDLNGRMISKSGHESQFIQLDVAGLERGHYLVKIQNNEALITRRIIVQ